MFVKKIIKKILRMIPLRNVIILSSLNDFDCNAGALFQYMLENGYDKKYIFVWSVINRDSLELYKNNKRVKIYMENSRSLLKRYYFYVAKYFIWDNHPFEKKREEQISIYLTHGVPPLKSTKTLISIDKNADFALCPSTKVKEWECREYNVKEQKIFICEQPRNDVLYRPIQGRLSAYKSSISNYTKTILWMPTFRKRLNGELDSTQKYFWGIPLIKSVEDLASLNNYLMSKGILIILKIHPQQMIDTEFDRRLTNITVIRDNRLGDNRIDINEIMPETDAMLGDYSTATWDYLLLDKPIGFVIPDIEEYKIGFSVPNPLYYMPGYHIKNIEDLYFFFDSLLSNEDNFSNARHVICNEVHEYQDGLNCERILKRFNI